MKRSVVIVLSLLALVARRAAARRRRGVQARHPAAADRQDGEVRRDHEEVLRDGRRGDQRHGRDQGHEARALLRGLHRQAGDRPLDRREADRRRSSRSSSASTPRPAPRPCAAVAEERKTPYLVVASADDAITQQNYKYVFRQNQVNAHYADALVTFLDEVVKPKTIAILYESSAFGTSGADAMEKDAKKIGIQVVLKEKYEAGRLDFKPILSKVKSLAAGRDLHGLLRHGRLAADEADQGAAHRREALRRRRRRLRDPRVHRQRQGRRRVRRQRDALDARRSSTRAPRSSPRSTRPSTATTPPTTAPRPMRRSSCCKAAMTARQGLDGRRDPRRRSRA